MLKENKSVKNQKVYCFLCDASFINHVCEIAKTQESNLKDLRNAQDLSSGENITGIKKTSSFRITLNAKKKKKSKVKRRKHFFTFILSPINHCLIQSHNGGASRCA